jgi:His-Xaa-Ser system radical SAM maturase HxsB
VASKFRSLDSYEATISYGYRLLPFKFTALDESEYALTNYVGQVTLLDLDTLANFVHHTLPSNSEAYKALKSRHFLLDSDSDVAIDLLGLKMRTRLARLKEFTSLHMFVVSLRCEHSCPYCQVSRQSDDRKAFDMSTATADKALGLVFRSPSSSIKIEFQGGEPMLNFELVQYIVERAEAINRTEHRDLQFVIATNLAMVTDDILTFCKDHEILISTSLDGPPDLHNQNRPRSGRNSYEKAVEGIQRARDALGRDRVSALMTTTQASLSRGREIIDEYLRLGFEGIFLRPLSPYGFAIKTRTYAAYDTDQWLTFYFDGLDYIMELNRGGVPFREHYAAIILGKMLTPFGTGYVDLRSPAGIGVAAIVYNYDGDVYASDESRMLAEMGDKTFRIGNVHENSWEEIMTSDSLLTPLAESFAESAPMCSDCAFEPFCGADPVFHHATQGDYLGHKPTSAFCRRNMAIFRRLIIMLRDDESARSIFLQWANS